MKENIRALVLSSLIIGPMIYGAYLFLRPVPQTTAEYQFYQKLDRDEAECNAIQKRTGNDDMVCLSSRGNPENE